MLWTLETEMSKKELIHNFYRFIGLGILIFILSRLDYKIVYQCVLNIDYIPLLLSIVLVIPVVATKALRWKRFLGDYGINLSWRDSIIVYFEGYGLGTVTPGQVGELVKILKVIELQKQAKKSQIFATIINDRIYDISSLTIFCFPFLLFGGLLDDFPKVILIPIMVVFFVLAYNPNLVLILFKNKIKYRLNQRYLQSFCLSLLVTTIIIVRGVLIFVAVGISVPVLKIGMYLPCVNLISLLPISISGFGTREAVIIYFFSSWNIEQEQLVLAGLLMGLIFFVMNGIIGSLVMVVRK